MPPRFSDGEFHGTFCCVYREKDPLLGERDVRFVRALASLLSEQTERERLREEKRRLEVKAEGTDALVAALLARYGYTASHSEEVVGLAVAVAQRKDLSSEETTDVAQVALLHDVGKIGIPDGVLKKRGWRRPSGAS